MKMSTSLSDNLSDDSSLIKPDFFIENTLTMAIVASQDGMILDWNSKTELTFEWDKTRELGQKLVSVLSTDFDAQEKLQNFLFNTDEKQPPLLEMFLQWKPEKEIFVEIGKFQTKQSNGETQVLVFINDITNRKKRERLQLAQFVVTRMVTEENSIQKVTPRLLQGLCESLEWDAGEMWTVNYHKNGLVFNYFWHIPTIPLKELQEEAKRVVLKKNEGIAGQVWGSKKPVFIANIQKHKDLVRLQSVLRGGINSAFAVPVVLNGEMIASLGFLSRKIKEPDEELLEVMEYIGIQVGNFIQRIKVEASLRESEHQIRTIFANVTEGLLLLNTLGQITSFNSAAEILTGYLSSEIVGGNLDLLLPSQPESLQNFLKVKHQDSTSAHWSIKARRKDDTLFPVELSLSSVIIAFEVQFVGVLRDVSRQKEHEEELKHQALHDILTGLPNRALFSDRLHQALSVASRSGGGVGILLMDMDRFKDINDI